MRTESEKIILQRIRDSRTRPLEKIAMINDEFKDKFKEVLHPTEEGFSTTHQVTTYPAVAAAISTVVLVGAAPVSLVLYPIATYTARWLWRKGKGEGR